MRFSMFKLLRVGRIIVKNLCVDCDFIAGEEMKVLFVCKRGADRSRTGAEMLGAVEGYECLSAGVWSLSKELINWSDLIFCMESEHVDAVLKICPMTEEKIKVLGIPDKYYFNQVELRYLLKERLRPYLGDEVCLRMKMLPDQERRKQEELFQKIFKNLETLER